MAAHERGIQQLEQLTRAQRAVSEALALELAPNELLAATAKALAGALNGQSSAVWAPGDSPRPAGAGEAHASGRTQVHPFEGGVGIWIAVGQGGPVLEVLAPSTLELDDAAVDFLDALGAQVQMAVAQRARLADSERILRHHDNIFAAMDEGILVADPDGVVEFANAAAGRALGARPASLIGSDLHALLHGDGSHRARDCRLLQALRAGEPAYFVDECFRVDGGPDRNVDCRCSPLAQGSGGSRPGAVLAFRDVSERADAEVARRREFDFLKVLLDSMEQGVVACDGDGRLTLFNRAMSEQLGRPFAAVDVDRWPEQFGLRDIRTGELIQASEVPLARALHGEEVDAEEMLVIGPHGERRVLTATARQLLGADGEVIGAVGIVQDETTQRSTLRRMEEAERLAGIGIYELDLDTEESFNSAGIGRILGMDPAQIDLESWQRAVHPEDVRRTGERLERAIASREPAWEDDYRIIRSDGSVRRIHVVTEAAYSPEGTLRRLRGSVQDYTDRADAEARGSQHDRMDSLGQLAGGIAHDFNNLLAVILSYTEFALEDLDAGSPVCEDLREIRKAAQRAADLTRRLLVFSRREVVRPQLVDIGVMLQGLRPVLARTLGEHLEIRADVTPGLDPVSADPSRLEQMLLNLALNARDAMPEGGVLSFTVGEVVLGAGERDDLEPGRYVRMTVSDTGIGMTPEVASHIFEPFFTTKLKGQGTGLGLSTAYGVINEMKGTISVQSAVGQGTTVEVLMPVAGDEITGPWPGVVADATPSDPGPRRILLVEDDGAVRTAAKRMLERGGYRVTEAEQGEAALKYLVECDGDVDLLLTDVVMPGMSGWNLHEEVSRRWPDIPTVFVSGYAAELIKRESLADGSIEFIAKPFSAPELLEVVGSQLRPR